MIVCNDVMAYMFGFFFGRTPLIKLSPKKTWEGFIGGGFATIIFGFIFSYFLCGYQYFVCPIEYSEELGRMTMECVPSYLFTKQEYTVSLVRKIKIKYKILNYLKFKKAKIKNFQLISLFLFVFKYHFSLVFDRHS